MEQIPPIPREQRRRGWIIAAGWGAAIILSLMGLTMACGDGNEDASPAAAERDILPSQGQALDFELTNQAGLPVRLSDLRDQVVLMNFFYATCVDFCPLMNTNLKQIYEALDEEARSQVWGTIGLVLSWVDLDEKPSNKPIWTPHARPALDQR